MMISNLTNEYSDYLKDESRLKGYADFICFPKNTNEIKEALHFAVNRKLPITIQGARTGITGGSVPYGGLIINMSQKNRIIDLRRNEDSGIMTLEPGVTLDVIREYTEKNCPDLFFPPDPTETSATIGGMVNTNASGAGTYKYGSTRNYIEELEIVLPDGSITVLSQENQTADGNSFTVSTKKNETIHGLLPSYEFNEIKNSSGYYIKRNMKMINLFIGSEGTLGILTSLKIKLIKKPPFKICITPFFKTEENALNFVETIRQKIHSHIAVIEFFDSGALANLKETMDEASVFSDIPKPPPGIKYAVYLELEAFSDKTIDETLMILIELIEECGGNQDDVWMADNTDDIEKLKSFRHAVPEAVNMRIDIIKKKYPDIIKLGTDMAVSDPYLRQVFEMYHKVLDKYSLKYVIFGHIGNNHVHINILPDNPDEYKKGRMAYDEIAENIVAMGGTVSAEHGIGKLKTELLRIMYSAEKINEMKRLKEIFDPKLILNRRNLFI